MDRLNQLRSEAGGSGDSTLDTSTAPSEAYLTANDSSKYFSLLEDDSSFNISKDDTDPNPESSVADNDAVIPNSSPIPKKSDLDSYQIGKQIEAANILSGGVDIFDDNDNSYDGDDLVIDDNVAEVEEKSNSELKVTEGAVLPDGKDDNLTSTIDYAETARPSKDTEVVLQIDGKNVDAIDIGNGLYLYRKEGEEELAAVQIIDGGEQQSSFKFLKVRENMEGNLEVYEEIEIEVPKEVPSKEGKPVEKPCHVPIKDINKVVNEPTKCVERKFQMPQKDMSLSETNVDLKEAQSEPKAEVNLNGKMMKLNESRKSPVIGSFTPMTFHSTPNKDGIPLTKTMVDQHLHPSRHSDNVKKTIEVHTDSSKQRILETPIKNNKEMNNHSKKPEVISTEQEIKPTLDEEVKDTKEQQLVYETLVTKTNVESLKITSLNSAESNVKDKEVKMLEVNKSSKQDNTLEQTMTIDKQDKKLRRHSDSTPENRGAASEINNLLINSEKIGSGSPKNYLAQNQEICEISNNENSSVNVISQNRAATEKSYVIDDVSCGVESKIIISTSGCEKDENKGVADIKKDAKASLGEPKNMSVNSATVHNLNKETSKSEKDENKGVADIDKDAKASVGEPKNMSENSATVHNSNKDTSKSEKDENKGVADIGKDAKASVGEPKNMSENSATVHNLNKDTSKSEKDENKGVADIEKDAKANVGEPKNMSENSATVHNLNKETSKSEKDENKSVADIEKDAKASMCESKNMSENSGTVHHLNKETSKSGEYVLYQQHKEIKDNKFRQQKVCQQGNTPRKEANDALNTVKQCSGSISDNINSTNNTPKSDLIQIENSKNCESSESNNKINLDKQLITSNDKAIESKALIKHSLEIQINSDEKSFDKGQIEKSQSSKAGNVIPIPVNDVAKNEIPKTTKTVEAKPLNNNHAAVPFGKWTEANRQEFLNKIKETKVPTNNSNTKQIKQPNDLNRRDILQKIDSQRQQQTNNAMAKVQEQQKLNTKSETTAFSKPTVKLESKIPVKERLTVKNKPICNKKNSIDICPENPQSDSSDLLPNLNVTKKDSTKRREINNQDLIDRTIEDIINRVPPPKTSNDEFQQNVQNTDGIEKQKGMTLFGPSYHAKDEPSVILDDIEMTMNELHGIPFVERPAHELPQKFILDTKIQVPKKEDDTSKACKLPNTSPFGKKVKQIINDDVILHSDDEIIEHEPITGDNNVDIKNKPREFTEKILESDIKNTTSKIIDGSKNDVIITEKDFDKFFRRNSVTYEKCLSVNYDGKEPHNVIQTVVEKEVAPKKLTRNEVLLAESKAKSTHKQQMLQARHNNHPVKSPTSNKYQTAHEESYGKNYQSKLQIAYHTALTAKRQNECPITIIEDKPVKVVFMDSNVDFLPSQLNVQGEKLSPIKKLSQDIETFTHSTTDSLDSDITDNFDCKSQDESKQKIRHQRKQVLTPVETPEMELIEPGDLGIEISPKKKRKIEDKLEKCPKNHVPKKSYLLGRTVTEDIAKTQNGAETSLKEIPNHSNCFVGHSNPISAIDNLVKAAELLENQAESNSSSSKLQDSSTSDSKQNTPIKRGRGRPRKYPLPDGDADKTIVLSPQKKPRLIDAKVIKNEETDDDDTSDDEIIKENWTMGKINENIVCPICNKLFRSENVVFKHVKHCTGPSPNRSESGKRRFRGSHDSETRSTESRSDMDIEEQEPTPNKRKSKEVIPKVSADLTEVILIEDTPLKEKPDKHHESRKSTVKTKVVNKPNNNLVCEICGKTFRQSSYLAHHKLQHKNDNPKKHESTTNIIKSVFSCEVCKKDFRKLHHLVQHRIIHNPNEGSSRILRKSSSEQGENKSTKEPSVTKQQNEDQSAGFRCEPCDKSFRKLHHLVEHRETHDGINRQKATEIEAIKSAPLHKCDICDKTFKKLHMLNEHKEQHLDTCSEKSDDKSVKSSLSTKDIIHECSLCYMVFPNEHSLTKHTVICQRKKKQSAAKAKQAAENKETENDENDLEITSPKLEEYEQNKEDNSLIIIEDNESSDLIDVQPIKLKEDKIVLENSDHNNMKNIDDIIKEEEKEKAFEPQLEPVKESIEHTDKSKVFVNTITDISNIKTSAISQNSTNEKDTKIQKTPASKKKASIKDKVAPTETKRQKSVNMPLPIVEKIKPSVDSSDDDEIRYMLNPNFKKEESVECKNFMRIKAEKRNSLQIERPSSNDLVKRRISLQHPPKIPRLKNKPLEIKSIAPGAATTVKSTNIKAEKATTTKLLIAKSNKASVTAKTITPKIEKASVTRSASKIDKSSATEPVPSTDSDDSEIKYSFPETVKDVITDAEVEKKPQKRQSLALKRKTLSGVAKRKSLGKTINSKHKLNVTPAKTVKKRTTNEAGHRCDCGQLFSSAALLSRHTTLDHTPPRIRRRRSPVPETETKTTTKPASRKSVSEKSKTNADTNKSSGQGDAESKPGVSTRKSSTNCDVKAPRATRKPAKSWNAAHKGVPVPEKMRKLMEKS